MVTVITIANANPHGHKAGDGIAGLGAQTGHALPGFMETGDTVAGFMECPLAVNYTAAMPRTIGYHLVKSGCGLWLPGDSRGHWSTKWDEEIGYIEPHRIHPGDAVRKRMALECMKHPPTRLDEAMILAVADAVGACVADSDWQVAAAAIESTHMHLLLTYTERDIDLTAKWIAQQTTKAVHRATSHTGPVWCEGKWLGFIYDEAHWMTTLQYIERHNSRRGLPPQPYAWIHP